MCSEYKSYWQISLKYPRLFWLILKIQFSFFIAEYSYFMSVLSFYFTLRILLIIFSKYQLISWVNSTSVRNSFSVNLFFFLIWLEINFLQLLLCYNQKFRFRLRNNINRRGFPQYWHRTVFNFPRTPQSTAADQDGQQKESSWLK